MPLYEYECSNCRQHFERIQKFSDLPVESCPSCGGQVSRLISSSAIRFKGSGWYVTDYARKSAGSEKSEGEAKSSETSEKPSTEEKKEKPATTKAKEE